MILDFGFWISDFESGGRFQVVATFVCDYALTGRMCFLVNLSDPRSVAPGYRIVPLWGGRGLGFRMSDCEFGGKFPGWRSEV